MLAAVAACSLFGAAGTAFGQNGYTANFPDTTVFQTNSTLTGDDGWNNTDTDKTPTTTGYNGEYVGDSDFVGIISGYSQNTTTDQWAFLGGLQHGTTAGTTLPGSTTSFLYRDFSVSNATTAYAFNVDFAVSSSQTPATGRDSFSWVLRSGSGATATNVFSLDFTPSTGAGSLNIGYTQYLAGTATGTTATANALPYNSRYHLTMSVGVLAGGAGLLNVSLTNNSTGAVTPVASNIALANATSVTEAAAEWILSTTAVATGKDLNGGYTGAGSNSLIFQNYAVTVPEPSTYALIGLGLAIVLVYGRRRARA